MTSGKIHTVAFIGLGIMGAPMAGHLVRAGFSVQAWARRSGPVQDLERLGGQGASSIADAVSGADAVVTVLTDGSAVAEVLLGEGGVVAHATPGTVLADMSTIDVATTLAVSEGARGAQLRTLDAPVSGGQQGAIDATLSIMVGGAPEDFDTMLPVFESLGRTIVHVGPAGAGQTVKAANQLLVGGTLALLAEAVVFLEAHDIDPTTAFEVLNGGLAGSRVLERRGPSMVARDFEPGFKVDLHRKDLGIVLDAAQQAHLGLPVTGLVAQMFTALQAQGMGHADHTSILALAESMVPTGSRHSQTV